MKQITLILLFFCSVLANAQTIVGSGWLDAFRLSINNTSGVSEDIYLILDNSATDGFDGSSKDGVPLNGNPATGLTTLIDIDGDGTLDTRLATDTRPYAGRYAVDFPLYMNFASAGTYTFRGTLLVNNAAVIFRLIDMENPDADVVDLADGVDHSITVDANKDYSGRWVVRVYAACLLKKNVTSANWTSASSWVSGHIPGQGSSALFDNAAYIPAESSVVIPTGTTLTIGALFNGGLVTINQGATLTVSNEARLANFSDIW